ncbi:NfeD family protein [Verrucomicrobiota bacterium sgz303538]
MNRWAVYWSILALMFLSITACAEKVALIKIDGPIGPATAGYISRAIHESETQGAECLVIQLDTPGGLLDSTKIIVKEFLSSPVPTVVYVAPSGATATSAGCFITLAADVAAMAPATAIGAAHPVEIGGSSTGTQSGDETMKTKVESYAVSYIETIASKRKRNVEWAISSVKTSASITAEKALELKVIEIIATDMRDLLRQLDGRTVSGRTLKTANAAVAEIDMSPRERVFQGLWRPEVMFLLMLVAIYGIIGELSNPGAILPGVVGAIALILSFYMASVLPVNIAGVALIVLAVALFIIDIFAPTHGVLTGGGVLAFLVGSLMLFDRSEPYLKLSLAYIIPATVVTALFFIYVVGAGLRAQRLPVKVGKEVMIGRIVDALTPIGPAEGKVFVEGEYWNAVSESPIEQGQPVEIVGIKGLTLIVKPKNTDDPARKSPA